MVARMTRSFGAANIMAKRLALAKSAKSSVWPGNRFIPARCQDVFEIGAVTTASTWFGCSAGNRVASRASRMNPSEAAPPSFEGAGGRVDAERPTSGQRSSSMTMTSAFWFVEDGMESATFDSDCLAHVERFIRDQNGSTCARSAA